MATDNHGLLFRCNEILKSVQVGGTTTLKSRNYFPEYKGFCHSFCSQTSHKFNKNPPNWTERGECGLNFSAYIISPTSTFLSV